MEFLYSEANMEKKTIIYELTQTRESVEVNGMSCRCAEANCTSLNSWAACHCLTVQPLTSCWIVAHYCVKWNTRWHRTSECLGKTCENTQIGRKGWHRSELWWYWWVNRTRETLCKERYNNDQMFLYSQKSIRYQDNWQ